jgi:putative holliday junction resolvase
MVPQERPVRHGPVLPTGGKARRKLHPLPILGNLEAWLGGLGVDPEIKPDAPLEPGPRPGLLALDVSRRAIGVAGADRGWQLATPLVTIRRKRWADDLAQLRAVLRERQAGALVIGWPLNMDGSEGPRCQAVRAFAVRLEAELGVPVLLWDERLSTFAAEEIADQAGWRARKRAAMLDALAAASLLQDALDALARLESRTGPERPGEPSRSGS